MIETGKVEIEATLILRMKAGCIWLPSSINRSIKDRYIFIDLFTRIPTPSEFERLHKRKKLPYTSDQLKQLYRFMKSLNLEDD